MTDFVSPSYVSHDVNRNRIRLPLEGWLDLTYRCNNNCLHCWLWEENSPSVVNRELTFDQICAVVDEARSYGCREWFISGGEPMLRPDFAELFEYITGNGVEYSLNTNGTLITPRIASLMRRKGVKMVAIYGADAAVHDAVTRMPGSFERCMRGMNYLREACAGFMVQVVPMRRNYHQLDAMVELARKLSPLHRVGVSWLHCSAGGDSEKNREISDQRLPASEVVRLDPVRPTFEQYVTRSQPADVGNASRSYIEKCAVRSRKFHLDPYGSISLCSLMKAPAMRFSVLDYSFADIWFEHIPQQALREAMSRPAQTDCTNCELQNSCYCCPAYAYLETGKMTEPVKYLCKIAKERKEYEQNWMKNNYRLYELGGMSIHVDSDLPFRPDTFGPALTSFITTQDGEDNLYISHRLGLPDLDMLMQADEVYKMLPWAIYRKGNSWIYLVLEDKLDPFHAKAVALFSDDYSRVVIYHRDDCLLREATNMRALTMFPSDQIMMSQVLARRNGCYLHSAGMILNGHGVLFVGQSGMGKSTVVKMLREHGVVLCDDRNILRRWPEGYRIHGTWSHGEVPLVANQSAPLAAIIFLEQAEEDILERNHDQLYAIRHLLNRVIKPCCDEFWWQSTMDLLQDVAGTASTYRYRFTRDKTKVIECLSGLFGPLESRSS